jgi:hypothetical protein
VSLDGRFLGKKNLVLTVGSAASQEKIF